MSVLDVRAPGWMHGATCAQVDPAVMFPPKGGSTHPAKKVCAVCPVAAKCLEWALRIEGEVGRMPGVYGGLSPVERRGLQPDHVCRRDDCAEPVAGRGFRYCHDHADQRSREKAL